MNSALVFPGQGSQAVGMGLEVYKIYAEAREVFEEVDEALKQKLSKIIFEGPIEDLTLTSNTQPALMATSIAILKVIEKQGKKTIKDLAKYVAGHSLGEYTALCAAGALTIGDTARLLKIRGDAMQQAVPQGKGAMAALIGVEFEEAKKLSESVSDENDFCEAANDNGGGQVVISGTVAAIDRAMAAAADFGIKRAVKLAVSAPFHSKLMQPAAVKMQEALAEVAMNEPMVPLVANVSAKSETDPKIIKDLLVKQVTGTVRWRESVLWLAEHNIGKLVEVGSGKVLSGLAKRIADVESCSISAPQDIDNFISQI